MRARIAGLFLLVMVMFWSSGCKGPTIYLPTPTESPSGPLPAEPLAPLATPMPALLEKRLLVLDWPLKMREKDSALIELTITMDEQGNLTATAAASRHPSVGLPIDIPDLYATHNVVAIARLDLAGVEAFREEIREPLLPGQDTIFRWSIRANEAGTYRGVVWLHLDLVPKAGGASNQVMLMARQIEIEAVTVFGLSGGLARIVGLIGLVLSTALGYPFVQDWVKKIRQRKSRKRAQPQSTVMPKDEKSQ